MQRTKVRKAGEPVASRAFKAAGWDMMKGVDATTCPRCHSVVVNRSGWLDYLAAPPGEHFWVEVKESHGDGYLPLTDLFTPHQREMLDNHLQEAYIFLVMRDEINSRAPKDVSAYLFTWDTWKALEKTCDLLGKRGLRRLVTSRLPGTDDLLREYKLEWKSGTIKEGVGRWVIPDSFRSLWVWHGTD